MKKILGFIKKHRKAIIIIAIIVVVGFGVLKIVQAVKNAQNILAGMQNSATTEEVEVRDIVNSVTATGTIVAVEKRTISSTVTGVKVKELNVEVGDQVQAGQILCLLDGENLEEQLADAETMLKADAGRSSIDVNSSNRGLNEAVVARDIDAQRAEEDKNKAYGHVQSAAGECEEAKTNYDNAKTSTEQAKQAMDAAEWELQNAKNADVYVLTDEEMAAALQPYMEALGRFESYLANEPGVNPSWKLTLDPNLGTFNIAGTSVSMIYNDDNSDTVSKIDIALQELNSCWQQYESAINSGSASKLAAIESARAIYQQAQATYEAAVAQEESRKTVYESAVKTVESMWDSYNNVVRSIDDSKRMDDSSVASRMDGVKNSQIMASTATLSDKRTIAQLQEQIDNCVVSASINGIVTDIGVIEGDTYLGGAIITIEDTEKYEVSAQIDEYEISKVEVGQEVVVKTNGTGTLEMKGQVKSIAPHATMDMGTSGVKYEVRIALLDNNKDIRLDMTAKVEIISDKRDGVLSVSAEAIQEDEAGKCYVEVFDGGSVIDTSSMLSDPESVNEEDIEKIQNGGNSYESHKVYVTTGLVGDYYTEVSGDGLEEGTKIVVPNEGAMSELEEYMNQAGMIGGF